IDEHDVVGAMDAEIVGIIDQLTRLILPDQLEAVVGRRVERLVQRPMHPIGDGPDIGRRLAGQQRYLHEWHEGCLPVDADGPDRYPGVPRKPPLDATHSCAARMGYCFSGNGDLPLRTLTPALSRFAVEGVWSKLCGSVPSTAKRERDRVRVRRIPGRLPELQQAQLIPRSRRRLEQR